MKIIVFMFILCWAVPVSAAVMDDVAYMLNGESVTPPIEYASISVGGTDYVSLRYTASAQSYRISFEQEIRAVLDPDYAYPYGDRPGRTAREAEADWEMEDRVLIIDQESYDVSLLKQGDEYYISAREAANIFKTSYENKIFYLKQTHPPAGLRIGESLPVFALEDVRGEIIDSTVFDDTPGMIYFFNTWCPFCKVKMPFISELGDRYPELEIIAVDRLYREQISREEVAAFMEENAFNSGLVFDADKSYIDACSVNVVPTIILVDVGGRVAGVFPGKWEDSEVEQTIINLMSAEAKEAAGGEPAAEFDLNRSIYIICVCVLAALLVTGLVRRMHY